MLRLFVNPLLYFSFTVTLWPPTCPSMAALWSKISAVLPPSEEDFPLQFSDRVEPSVVETLRRCRQLLYREAAASGRMLQAQIVLDYSWEKLNTGTWRQVDKDWRRVYSYGCLFKVAALCHRDPSPDAVLQAVRTCDMALLMGAAIMGDALQLLVRILQREVGESARDGDEGEPAEAKVGGPFHSAARVFPCQPPAGSVLVASRCRDQRLISNCRLIAGSDPAVVPPLVRGGGGAQTDWNSGSL